MYRLPIFFVKALEYVTTASLHPPEYTNLKGHSGPLIIVIFLKGVKMKSIILVTLALFISGCATKVALNKDYESRNIALVKNTIFDPILSIKTKSTTLKAIDGKAVKDKWSHEVPAGEHNFTASCQYYETSTFILTGEHTFKVNLKKGHTYKLTPVPAKHKATGKVTCVILTKDLTEI